MSKANNIMKKLAVKKSKSDKLISSGVGALTGGLISSYTKPSKNFSYAIKVNKEIKAVKNISKFKGRSNLLNQIRNYYILKGLGKTLPVVTGGVLAGYLTKRVLDNNPNQV